jgi:hypothetical protein
MVYKKPELDASGAPPPGRQRASLDLNEAPCVSQLSVPADLAYPEAAGSVRGASCDGLLLLDFADTRQFPPAVRKLCHKSLLHEMAVSGDGAHLDVARFVCNPLSGQLCRLPAPDTDAVKMGTPPFGLLTQSPEGSHGLPDRFVVAQLGRGEGDSSSRVLRRYLSDTGEWDERELLAPSTAPPAWRAMQIDTDHEVLALGDRLWWVDLSLGVCSVDPFSDRPEHRFVELPDCSALPAAETGGLALAESPMLSRYRRLGVSEGKLRYVQLCNIHQPFQIGSFSLDAETCSWTLDHAIKIAETSPGHIFNAPWIAAIDPFRDNVLFFLREDSETTFCTSNMVELLLLPWIWLRGWRFGGDFFLTQSPVK